jgi:putative acyl-CoA dehydrogenase
MECLGGNGYTEEFPLARRYREQPVMAIWEGSGNVIALDVLRALTRERESVAAFDAELASARGSHSACDAHHDRLRHALREAGESSARALVAALAVALQASLLIRHSPPAVADAFVAARLGPDRGSLYGELPPGLDLSALVARA